MKKIGWRSVSQRQLSGASHQSAIGSQRRRESGERAASDSAAAKWRIFGGAPLAKARGGELAGWPVDN